MTTAHGEPPLLVGSLAVKTPWGAFLGDTRIRLLEAIARHGSISRAAKAVPLSYKAAWDALDSMNNLADAPLVESTIGGRRGGGTRLTDYGQRLVTLYRDMEQEYQAAVERLAQGLDAAQGAGSPGSAGTEFQALLRRMAMRTSARNQLVGTLEEINLGDVNAEVIVALDERTRLTAVVTRDSAAALGLRPGLEIQALVKASAVMLTTDRTLRTSARNQLWGEVGRIHEGPVQSEVTLLLPGGRTLTSVITPTGLARLGLAPGQPACAVFQASSVVLATFA